ncbi:MAG TPA: bifunctional phosphopantothenoylcysteine decarboxylase/phosphopantothenate--cysteine ligase CoaBC [Oceanospirillales bacterium]|nr:bifunctional phosphopantothenoylcysteine decarboxylase/phosphopantothenate--cysteine ligase CoaBC [Oceanospirillales bacterium]
MKILLMMSGSIAAAKATGLISLWRKAGHEVKVACTSSVFEFVGKATLEGLSDNSVVSAVFEEDNMMQHICLSRWADIIVLAPATANIINKLVAGIADDIVTTLWVAALELGKPMYLAPAMNSMMWNYPATKNSIKQLQNWCVNVLLPQSGELACGENGTGRLMEIDDLNNAIFKKQKDKYILITAGGTREYIDGVRYIGNLSTGRTGAQVADYFTALGYQVTWLGAINAIQPNKPCSKIIYETFNDLSDKLKDLLENQHFDAIIHAAAISDFSVASISINGEKISASRQTKLPSSESIDLKLKKNPKLVSQLLNWSKNLDLKVIAFKLTNTSDKNQQKIAVMKLLKQDGIDFVAHNDLSDITVNQHSFCLYPAEKDKIQCESVADLCKNLDI